MKHYHKYHVEDHKHEYLFSPGSWNGLYFPLYNVNYQFLKYSNRQYHYHFISGTCLGEAGLNFRNYHGVDKIHNYLNCLKVQHQDKVEVFDIGRSSENRPLRVIKIGRRNGGLRPAVWIDAGIHAREWISPASILYLINQLVENYGSPENRNIVDNLDVYILPSANPDGQVF